VKLVTVKVPELYIEGLDELVKLGRYSSRSEAIRVAIRELLRRELWTQTKKKNVLEELSSIIGIEEKRVTVGWDASSLQVQEENYKEALKWFRKAADQGNALA
jgi:antitoxin ParD1/3/4